jgi:hypothetical protein
MVLRSRLLRLIVTISLVALAAVGLRVSETPKDRNFEIVRGVLGEPVVVNGGTITASDVRVGTAVSQRDEVSAVTPGLFVVVRVEVAATGSELIRPKDMRVLTRNRRYDDFGNTYTGQAEPGFASSTDAVFEVDPADLADLTLEVYQVESVAGYAQHARIHLGITRGNAEQWRTAGKDQTIEARPLSLRAV